MSKDRSLREIRRAASQAVADYFRHDAEEQSQSIIDWSAQHLRVLRDGAWIPWDPAHVPFWSYWMRLAQARLRQAPLTSDPTAHLVEDIYLVAGTQLGKSWGLLYAILCWVMAVAPRTTALVLPSDNERGQTNKLRLRPLFEQSPRLARLLPESSEELARRIGSKSWLFPSAILHFLNGSTANDLRSRDIPLILPDEFDVYPGEVGRQGDPLSLLHDRQKSYPHERLLVGITTPTGPDRHGWQRLCSGTHERLLVACHGCGGLDWLDPSHLRPSITGTPSELEALDAVQWVCPRCGTCHSTADRDAMVARASAAERPGEGGGWVPGRWVQDARTPEGRWEPVAEIDQLGHLVSCAPPAGKVRSGWLNSLYARSVSLSRFYAEEKEAAAGSPARWQAFVNSWRAEPWNGSGGGLLVVDTERLSTVGDNAYPLGSVPDAEADVLILTADQQGNTRYDLWFAYVLRAWHADGTSYLVDTGRLDGFDALSAYAARTWLVGDRQLAPAWIAADEGNGNMAEDLRAWADEAAEKRLTMKGYGNAEYLVVEAPRTGKGVMRWHRHLSFSPHFTADELVARLRGVAGAPPWRTPGNLPQFYLESLRSEEQAVEHRRIGGRMKALTVWRPKKSVDLRGRLEDRRDTHWLDAERMQIAVATWCRLLPPEGVSEPTSDLASSLNSAAAGRRRRAW